MKNQRMMLSYAALALLVSTGTMTWGQPQNLSAKANIPHTPYNDLLIQVHESSAKVFASPEARKSAGPGLLEALDQLAPLVQRGIDQPGSEIGTDALKQLQAIPAAAQQMKQLHMQQLQAFHVIRLALEEPHAVQTYRAQIAKGGASAAQASVDRAAADWLIAGQDAQSSAFDTLRVAIQASGQRVPAEVWSTLVINRPPVSAALASSMLDYLRSYAGDNSSMSMLILLQTQVQRAQLDNSPLTLQGTLLSGTPFTTANWKGKVVLAYVWSTACEGSDKEVARAQAIYDTWHAQGLEVVGIAHAPTLDTLKKFMAANPACKMPQVYRGPLAINRLAPAGAKFDPTVRPGAMVIDRKGIMHWIDLSSDQVNADLAKWLHGDSN